mmetsp:Transcript_3650/g.5535  ORF Transcript_3650/g.5535 Transcript_3650/m.5535 type:complete len:404 (+) Transcript_3650:185-1396(+)
MVEATEYLVSSSGRRRVVLVIQKVPENGRIEDDVLTHNEIKDLNRGREYLEDVAKRHRTPCFSEIEPAVRCIIDLKRQKLAEISSSGMPEPDPSEISGAVEDINRALINLQKKLASINALIETKERQRVQIQEQQQAVQASLKEQRVVTHGIFMERNALRQQVNDLSLQPILAKDQSDVPAKTAKEELQAILETLKAKDAALASVKAQEDSDRRQLEQLRRSFGSACTEVTCLLADRRALREKINDHYAQLRTLREEFHDRRESWFHQIRDSRGSPSHPWPPNQSQSFHSSQSREPAPAPAQSSIKPPAPQSSPPVPSSRQSSSPAHSFGPSGMTQLVHAHPQYAPSAGQMLLDEEDNEDGDSSEDDSNVMNGMYQRSSGAVRQMSVSQPGRYLDDEFGDEGD